MLKTIFLNVKKVRMNVPPIYNILDDIERSGTGSLWFYDSVSDTVTQMSSIVLRDFIVNMFSLMFHEGDILSDGNGYTVLRNGEWTDYKVIPLISDLEL